LAEKLCQLHWIHSLAASQLRGSTARQLDESMVPWHRFSQLEDGQLFW